MGNPTPSTAKLSPVDTPQSGGENLQQTATSRPGQDHIEQLGKLYSRRTGRYGIITVLSVIMASVSVLYLFYLVAVMQQTMNDMSENITRIQQAVVVMSDKINTLREETSEMGSNVEQLNQSVGEINKQQEPPTQEAETEADSQ